MRYAQTYLRFSAAVATACLLLSFFFLASAQDLTQSYFPLHIGNTWEYRYDFSDTLVAQAFQVFDTTRIDDQRYFLFGERIETAYPVREDSLGRIWRVTSQGEVLWLDPTLGDSATYQVDLGFGERPFNVLVRRNLNIDTFAGRFQNCIEFFFDEPGSYDEEQWYTLAPHVGPVRVQYGGAIRKVLFSATINGKIITGLSEHPQTVDRFHLSQNYPNPFNHSTEIEYQIPFASAVDIAIYAISGKRIRMLLKKSQQPGIYKIQWDGKDDRGGIVSSGTYLYRIKAKQFSKTRKLLFLK